MKIDKTIAHKLAEDSGSDLVLIVHWSEDTKAVESSVAARTKKASGLAQLVIDAVRAELVNFNRTQKAESN